MVSGIQRFLLVAALASSAPLVSLFTAPRVQAQVNDTRLILRIEGALPNGVTAEMIRAAIAAELSVDVALESSGLPGRGMVIVKFDGAKATLMFSAGASVQREIAVPKKPQQTVEIVALIVGNLARDEAGALIAELQVKIGVAAGSGASASTSAPASASAPTSATAPASASASVPASATVIAPPPASAPPVPPPFPASSPCTFVGGAFGADLLPGVGTSTAERGRRATRVASLNLAGGLSHGLMGFELAGGVNIKTGFMCGVQLAGGANIVHGPARGAQISGGFNYASDLHGAQLTGGGNIARDGYGAQVSGGVNIARDMFGFQLTGGINIARVFGGLQLAPVNLARDVNGVQLGVVNIASGRVHGVQFGVVNFADDVDVPIGVVNIMRHGRTHFDLFTSESGWTSIGVVHGGRRVHNIWALGVQPATVSGKTMPTGTYGIGIRAHETPSFSMDVDALVTSFIRFRGTAEQTMEFFTIQPELRVVFAVPVFDGASLMFGPSVRVLVTTDPESKPQSPFGGWKTHDERNSVYNAETDSTQVSAGTAGYIIPGIVAGLRL